MNEIASKEEMRIEAVKRMRALNLSSTVISDFEKHDTLYLSEGIGYLYFLNEEQLNIVKDFEEKYGYVVYHVIRSFTNFGEMFAMLFVGEYTEDWEYDNIDIQDNIVMSYVYNVDYPDCSDMGSIGYRSNIGGLVRVF